MLSQVKYLRFGVVAILLVLNGCVISPRRDGGGNNGGGNNGGGGGGFGRIYVTNAPNNSIIRFDNASTVSGNATPGTTISGSATLLATPQYLFLDVANNRLFVANQGGGNILVFDNATTQTGNAAPTRTIGGSNTGLFSPVDVALDRTKDLLYVADSTAGTVGVFASGSTAGGNISPVRSLTLGFVPSALFSDSTNDRLFVADISNNAVHVFDNASTLNGGVAAPRILNGVTTQLNQPAGLQVDNTGRLLVTNFNGGTVTIYSGAATVNGSSAPVATIGGTNTGISQPTQIVLNNTTTTGDLYLADGSAGSVIIFAGIGSANGNINATRTISGSNTGLARSGGVGPFTAKGIALDTAR
jgi:6-phosphogluconolactonase (cycloisomerase 2 family)